MSMNAILNLLMPSRRAQGSVAIVPKPPGTADFGAMMDTARGTPTPAEATGDTDAASLPEAVLPPGKSDADALDGAVPSDRPARAAGGATTRPAATGKISADAGSGMTMTARDRQTVSPAQSRPGRGVAETRCGSDVPPVPDAHDTDRMDGPVAGVAMEQPSGAAPGLKTDRVHARAGARAKAAASTTDNARAANAIAVQPKPGRVAHDAVEQARGERGQTESGSVEDDAPEADTDMADAIAVQADRAVAIAAPMATMLPPASTPPSSPEAGVAAAAVEAPGTAPAMASAAGYAPGPAPRAPTLAPEGAPADRAAPGRPAGQALSAVAGSVDPDGGPAGTWSAASDATVVAPVAVAIAAPAAATAASPAVAFDGTDMASAGNFAAVPPVAVGGVTADAQPVSVPAQQISVPSAAVQPIRHQAAPGDALALLDMVRHHVATRGQPDAPLPADAPQPVGTDAMSPTPVFLAPQAGATLMTPAAASAIDVGATLGSQAVDMGVSGQWIDGLAREIATLSADGAQGRFRIDAQQLGPVQVDIRQAEGGTAVSLTVASEAAEIALRQDSDRLKLDGALSSIRISDVRIERVPAELARADAAGQQPQGQASSGSQHQAQQQSLAWQQGGGQSLPQNRGQMRENMSSTHKDTGDDAVLNHEDAGVMAREAAHARYA
ncbi:hypothetical protein J3E64_003292 [Sphingobium sp. OAS761]|uniref:hypothetical protein n=1 Tax=Sphingobium sp. OAS761 TaxID=2817901 RepID=UPI00209FDF54|nr:hypothetical protein [Sphingobium sp. OAS761]MCP1471581.1 hypothetical protein [Sphingobium sp. OAS761]